jgi:hypothetical protein
MTTPEIWKSVYEKKRDRRCGVVAIGPLVDEVVSSASGEFFCPVVERFRLGGIHCGYHLDVQ